MDFVGAGTVLNVLTVTVGALAGMAVGGRLPQSTREVVTDCLGLTTLLMAALSAMDVRAPELVAAVGTSAPVLIVLGSLLVGSILGSLLGIERWLGNLAGAVQHRLGGADDHAARERFIEGWLTASLLFCVGPLTILGALSDGMGHGHDELALKSTLDGFAAIAFIGIAVFLLVWDMLRRIRRGRYREEVNAQLDAEEQARAAAAAGETDDDTDPAAPRR